MKKTLSVRTKNKIKRLEQRIKHLSGILRQVAKMGDMAANIRSFIKRNTGLSL